MSTMENEKNGILRIYLSYIIQTDLLIFEYRTDINVLVLVSSYAIDESHDIDLFLQLSNSGVFSLSNILFY